MVNYCLDTNIVSEILRGNEKIKQRLIDEINAGNRYSLCVIVYYEIVRGLIHKDTNRKIDAFKTFYDKAAEHFILDKTAANKAAEIYADLKSKGLKVGDSDNDIFIAAISIVNGCTLVTANTRHFERVEGLNFVNWRD